jgi:hypothetical protein
MHHSGTPRSTRPGRHSFLLARTKLQLTQPSRNGYLHVAPSLRLPYFRPRAHDYTRQRTASIMISGRLATASYLHDTHTHIRFTDSKTTWFIFLTASPWAGDGESSRDGGKGGLTVGDVAATIVGRQPAKFWGRRGGCDGPARHPGRAGGAPRRRCGRSRGRPVWAPSTSTREAQR